jgi:hypothetical protein
MNKVSLINLGIIIFFSGVVVGWLFFLWMAYGPAWRRWRPGNKVISREEQDRLHAELDRVTALVYDPEPNPCFFYLMNLKGEWWTSCSTTGAPQWTPDIERAEPEHVMNVEAIVRGHPGCRAFTEFEWKQLKKVSHKINL